MAMKAFKWTDTGMVEDKDGKWFKRTEVEPLVEELDKSRSDLELLDAMQEAGVDNWEGMSHAQDILTSRLGYDPDENGDTDDEPTDKQRDPETSDKSEDEGSVQEEQGEKEEAPKIPTAEEMIKKSEERKKEKE